MTNELEQHDTVVATFAQHRDAEEAIHELASRGFDTTQFSIVGRGLSALGAAFTSAGIARDSVIHYEGTIKSDGFLVVGTGAADEMSRAGAVLESSNPTRFDLHENVKARVPAVHAVVPGAKHPPVTAPGALQKRVNDGDRYFATQDPESPPSGNTFQETVGVVSHWNDTANATANDAPDAGIGSVNDTAAYRYGKEMRIEDRYHDCSWEDAAGRLKDGWPACAIGASTWAQSENAVRRGWHSSSPDLDDDSYYRAHWNAVYANGASESTYDERVPAYLYGGEAHRSEKYRGRDWREVEVELASEWSARHPAHPSSWERLKDAVRHGWNRVIPGMDGRDTVV